MIKLTNFFLSHILDKKVYDEMGDCIGKLQDIYVINDANYPRAICYKLKKGVETYNYEFKDISFYQNENGKIIIKIKGGRDIILRKYSYLLSKHLLDKQIVDINGKKLVRVNDLRMAQIAGELKVVAVDTGTLALGRRLGIEEFVKRMYKFMNKKPKDSLIIWNNVEALEMANDNLRLTVSCQKLSKLHPADLADILEDMDINYRHKVFQSLDEDLAADTLEEIQPEVQADIIKNLSQVKTSEVLESMPNDEIADILDEVDEETAEKILLNMQQNDADEIRTLLEYEEETVGSIMNKDFICFNVNITVGETLDLIRDSKPEEEVMYYIYIVDENFKINGIVSLRDLLIANLETRLMDIMKTDVVKVRHKDDVDKAVEKAIKYNLLSLPVEDDEGKLCGTVILYDIIDDLASNWKKHFKKVV